MPASNKIATKRRLKINPDLIPHAEFHTGIWLRAVERPGWYYFLRRKNPNIIRHKEFYGGVDKPLRKLVKFLHEMGIRTTPSCAGHHYKPREFKKIYAGLEKESEIIRTRGLKLHDVQTGEKYFLRDKNYRLPWNLLEFIAKAESYQQRGVIGMRLQRRKKAKAGILAIRRTGIRIRERDAIVFIFVNENRAIDTRRQWKIISDQVMTILRP